MDRKTSLMWHTVSFLKGSKEGLFHLQAKMTQKHIIHILCAVKTVISKNTGRDLKSLNFGQCEQTLLVIILAGLCWWLHQGWMKVYPLGTLVTVTSQQHSKPFKDAQFQSQSMTSSHSKEQGHSGYKQSFRQWDQETESQGWSLSQQGRAAPVISLPSTPDLCARLSRHLVYAKRKCVCCVCVLWLISVRGKWKPLISHLSLLRKSCHSLWTRCHLHSFNQDLSHCLTCSCTRILIWGLYARLRFSFNKWLSFNQNDCHWGEISREFSAKSHRPFTDLGLLPSWMACAFSYNECFVGTMSCQVLKWTKCILHTTYTVHSGSSEVIQVEIIVK